MTAVVWANVVLAVPFLIAFIGIPLWIVRHQSTADLSQARAYLDAKAALAEAGTATAAAGVRPSRRPMARTAFGRRNAATARRDHARQAARHAGAPA